jgi:hypothetical protein
MPASPSRQDVIHQGHTSLLSHGAERRRPRRWLKRYNVEVAASSASVLSTIIAVSPIEPP